MNRILAHRPWLMKKCHIEKLVRGQNNWSVSELAHAISILVHFHSLASFVFGLGITAEIDHENGHTFRPPSMSETNGIHEHSPNSISNLADAEAGVEVLMQRMKKLTEESQEQSPASQEEMLQRYEKVESQTLELPVQEKTSAPQEDILRFIDDPDFQYQDFARRRDQKDTDLCDNIPTFRIHEYSWEDHGFSLLNRLYSDMGNLLDEKFRITYDLTYYTMGVKEDVDTSTFRRAIWNYIQCIFGIRHDDYDYREVNELLERSMKSFIKTASCYPDRCTRKDYDGFMKEFKHSEKVHVNLMLLEARMQAELLYALRAIMQYMT